MEELGRVPQARETLERQGLLIEVLDASETQVLRARITRTAPVTETRAEEPAAPPPAAGQATSQTARPGDGGPGEPEGWRPEGAGGGESGRDDDA
jgi:hypothetical protein